MNKGPRKSNVSEGAAEAVCTVLSFVLTADEVGGFCWNKNFGAFRLLPVTIGGPSSIPVGDAWESDWSALPGNAVSAFVADCDDAGVCVLGC